MLAALADGQILLADRAYDSDALRKSLDERGAGANIKPMPGRRNVPAFSSYLYRYRNLVERFFNKIKHYRAVATRYDKRADNFLAGVKLASIRVWLHFNEFDDLVQSLSDAGRHEPVEPFAETGRAIVKDCLQPPVQPARTRSRTLRRSARPPSRGRLGVSRRRRRSLPPIRFAGCQEKVDAFAHETRRLFPKVFRVLPH